MSGDIVEPSLPKLLAALAVGARSVNHLPVSGKNEDGGDSEETDSENEELDDEFSYQMAFPEFNSICLEARSRLSSLLKETLKISMGQDEDLIDEEVFEFDDPRLWESAAEVCDVLLERVDLYIQNVKEGRAGLDTEQIDAVRHFGTLVRNKARGDFDQLVGSLVDMEKPQVTYGFADDVQNSRREPFCPRLSKQSPHILELVPGNGLNSRRFGGSIPDDIIAPTHHYLHPYQSEIDSLSFQDEQLVSEESGVHGRSGTLHNKALAKSRGIWIDTEVDLAELAAKIGNNDDSFQEIAIDLEAHNFRSFSGFVCTMQLSLRRPSLLDGNAAHNSVNEDTIDTGYDFIIDTLALRNVINKYFAPIFADKNIVKVMHGADSDIKWLQRDFGIYVVNLFDTGRASRILPNFSSYGLAYLLRKYANVDADKKHQLSDWRQRPIPDEMRQYAISDTMYLLDIYEKMKHELKQYQNDDVNIEHVLEASKRVCLIRYDNEPFVPSSYRNLTTSKRGKRKGGVLSNQQEEILKALFDWRDATAREEDESLQYVCPNSGLIRIATTAPRNVASLQSCVNPVPPLVLKYNRTVLSIVQGCLAGEHSDPVPFSKDEIKDEIKCVESSNGSKSEDESHKVIRGSMMSPVLGTEALYKQAGWMTPQVQPAAAACIVKPSSSSEDSATSIVVHSSNNNFTTNSYTSHSLEMRQDSVESEGRRSRSVDGLGAARVILNQLQDSISKEETSVEMQKKIAENCTGRIRNIMTNGNQNLLGLVKGTSFDEGDVNGDKEEDYNESNILMEGCIQEVLEQDTIPKSMKEIYRISNRNRRKAKKNPVVFENDESLDTGENEEELKAAEVILSKSGPNGTDYFDRNIDTNKRQRTKSHDESSRVNDESPSPVNTKAPSSKEDDMALMAELGWVKNKEEAESLFCDPNLKIYDPNTPVSDNPFFAGAAISGGTLQNSGGKSERKKGIGRKGRKNTGGKKSGQK